SSTRIAVVPWGGYVPGAPGFERDLVMLPAAAADWLMLSQSPLAKLIFPLGWIKVTVPTAAPFAFCNMTRSPTLTPTAGSLKPGVPGAGLVMQAPTVIWSPAGVIAASAQLFKGRLVSVYARVTTSVLRPVTIGPNAGPGIAA